MPVGKITPGKTEYDIYPDHDLGCGKVHDSYGELARRVAGCGTVVVDGYVGVDFDRFVSDLNSALVDLGVKAVWWRVDSAMKPSAEVDRLIAPYLGGDDPIFGFRASDLSLEDFFDMEALRSISPDPSAGLNIIVGTGASLSGWKGTLLYLDIPKNEIQFRSRAGSIVNLGASEPMPPKKMYKRFYFVDWIVLNKHKKSLLPSVDVFVDAQRETEVTWAEGEDVRRGLREMSRSGFRVRPWFEPGAWGGQRIKEFVKALPQDVPNYAWSFELIVPENGLIFSGDGKMLELSFDSLMYCSGEDVVGDSCYREYGDEFPIRLDYLDNFDGGNLSVQCHPRLEFIRKNFGEVLTQEETYYILDNKPGSEVYLGFKEDIVPEEFKKALEDSHNNATPLDVNKYINAEPSVKHGLYLIPPGTLHSSGRDNLVLEISTTPYIFTFKMYDWMAVDLDGKPRPLNIERAMANLYFDRKGDRIAKKFVSHPSLIEKGDGWELWHLPTHRNHSYDVHRYVVDTQVEVKTEGKFHVLNLVQGTSAAVVTADGREFHLSYAESLVISAACGSYRIISDSGERIMVVKAFMK